ncbi:hypothetical protein E24_00084 [Faustovirus]|nr:hypothetical protein PRJ_Fausto_00075 [Faustovirus]AMN83017.1 hypothetical protein E24_00084 [Faustovirus]AMN84002.1 hypothetical protein D5a_00084 [Faustovirus]AMN84987.1 hypothetical protein E23_00084 [Faustovirus]QBR98989.1 hypothetical protein [Faustovirus mariensis]
MSFTRKNVTLRIDDIGATALCYDNVELENTGYRLVGRSTSDIFTNKIMIDSSNTIASNNLLIAGSAVAIGGSAPTIRQVLKATSTSSLTFSSPFGATTGITAFAGGGQGSATQLTTVTNIVTTVATIADSIKLPLAADWLGDMIIVKNNGANSLNLFPGTGDSINALGANNPLAVAAAGMVQLVAVGATSWQSVSAA